MFNTGFNTEDKLAVQTVRNYEKYKIREQSSTIHRENDLPYNGRNYSINGIARDGQ